MEKTRILFVSQEITPYLPETEMSIIGRYLPQGIQEKGMEIRTFMPRFGTINERRNQLHEVIRLSGMNLIIDDTDHPLIIKVASIQSARMQIYFIDNEDYFQRKSVLFDSKGKPFVDNDERAIFYTRGVIETVKKLRWSPDIIHCHGWISCLMPFYLKQAFHDDPLFTHTKIIYSVYNDEFAGELNSTFKKKLLISGTKDKHVEILKQPTFFNITKFAIDLSDGVIIGSKSVSPEIESYIKTLKKPYLEYQSPETYIDNFALFYNKILAEN